MDLLGDRDPFAVQEEQHSVLEKEIAGLDDAILPSRKAGQVVDYESDPTLGRLGIGFSLKMLRALSDEQMERYGLHNERGPESVRKMMRMTAGHDLLHRHQIKRIKRVHGIE
jgi:hypothetical protein